MSQSDFFMHTFFDRMCVPTSAPTTDRVQMTGSASFSAGTWGDCAAASASNRASISHLLRIADYVLFVIGPNACPRYLLQDMADRRAPSLTPTQRQQS